MQIAFIGAVEFSRRCLAATLEAGGEVVLVVAPPAEKARRNADWADLQGLAAEKGLPFQLCANVNDPAVVQGLRAAKPDVLFVFGLSQLVGPELLAIPRLGVIGSHPSLLPEGRGRHPLIWALALGLRETGLSFFWADEGADSGDILWQRPFSITPEDDAATLYRKISNLAETAISEFLPQLAAGTAPRRKQDSSRATYWRKRGEADGEIDWSGPSTVAHNLVRALTRPYVGAHTFLAGERLTVWRAHPVPAPAGPAPGTVLASAGGLTVKTQDGALRLTEFDGPAAARLAPGSVLGPQAGRAA